MAEGNRGLAVLRVAGIWFFSTLVVFMVNPIAAGIWLLVLTPQGGTVGASGQGGGWQWTVEPHSPVGYAAAIALISFGIVGMVGSILMVRRLSREA